MNNKKPLNLPHDSYFKSNMEDLSVARDFIESHLPKELLVDLDLEHLQVCHGEFVDKRLLKSVTDIPKLLQNTKFMTKYFFCDRAF